MKKLLPAVPLLLSGCSFAFVDGPRVVQGPEGREIACTESKLWPTLDYTASGGYALVTLGTLALADFDVLYEVWGVEREAAQAVALAALIPATGALVHWIAARGGSGKVDDCRRMKLLQHLRDTTMVAGGRSQPYPSPPRP